METKITQKQIDEMCGSLVEARAAIDAARRMAFRLAKDGNREGVFQLRGEFAGILEAAKTTDGFLVGLREMFD